MRFGGILHLSVLGIASNISSSFQLLATSSIADRKSTLRLRTQLKMSSSLSTLSDSKHVLFDLPVSNNGARCRIILYKKGIPKEEVDLVSPMELGGLKSDEFLKLNPAGLMPCLSIQKPDNTYGISALSESDTIARYLISEYAEVGPSFLVDHPLSNQIARWHDVYLTTIQGAMYKTSERIPFGNYADRKSAISAYRNNLAVIESFMGDETGMYLCGDEVSLADATLFPSMVFASYILPKFDDTVPALPPKLARWYENLKSNDDVFATVYAEIQGVLENSWDANGRWDDIWLAGKTDTAPGTLFDKIIAGEIPASIVKEDDHILAFKDINPMAPAHILVIPKDRSGLTNLRQASAEHTNILGKLLVAAGEIANDTELGFGDGARIVINDGSDGCQEVMHLHVHVLGGRKLEGKLG